jgi:uncharacterized protein
MNIESPVEPMVFRQQISVPYQYTAGPAHRAFLHGLVDRRVLGSRHGDEVLVPARPFGPDGTRTGELVEVADTGVVQGFTTRVTSQGQRTYAMILLDGATTAMLHVVDAPADVVQVGTRVRARWGGQREPEITAIEAFVPVTQEA